MIIITSGIQCSGKSTWCSKFKDTKFIPTKGSTIYVVIISRDTIREENFGKNYVMNSYSEEKVTEIFNGMMNRYTGVKNVSIILDNCFCREKYIDEIIAKYPQEIIKIKFFDIPLWKAYYRNMIRWWKTEKFIPFKVIRQFKKNFDKINRNKYEQYIF